MKWIRFEHDGRERYGVADGENVALTGHSWADVLAGRPPAPRGHLDRAAITPLNPVERPGKIICIGKNYLDHCRETNSPPPRQPVIFAKFATSLNHPGQPITWSAELTTSVDFEAELAVVIGRTARHVPEADALDYVAGYTTANDVTARDLQRGDGQWIRGKSLDTFCPLGPVFVTADEIPDPQGLAIRCLVNGVTMQDSHTREMIFGVAHLVAFCSRAFTLEPGDVILTGTPHGVGIGRTPPVWLRDGDEVTVEIDGIGRLTNPCRVTA